VKVDAALRDKPWSKDMPVCFDDTTRAITRANESFVTHSVSLPLWLNIPCPQATLQGRVAWGRGYANIHPWVVHPYMFTKEGMDTHLSMKGALMFVMHSWLAELHTENVARGGKLRVSKM